MFETLFREIKSRVVDESGKPSVELLGGLFDSFETKKTKAEKALDEDFSQMKLKISATAKEVSDKTVAYGKVVDKIAADIMHKKFDNDAFRNLHWSEDGDGDKNLSIPKFNIIKNGIEKLSFLTIFVKSYMDEKYLSDDDVYEKTDYAYGSMGAQICPVFYIDNSNMDVDNDKPLCDSENGFQPDYLRWITNTKNRAMSDIKTILGLESLFPQQYTKHKTNLMKLTKTDHEKPMEFVHLLKDDYEAIHSAIDAAAYYPHDALRVAKYIAHHCYK